MSCQHQASAFFLQTSLLLIICAVVLLNTAFGSLSWRLVQAAAPFCRSEELCRVAGRTQREVTWAGWETGDAADLEVLCWPRMGHCAWALVWRGESWKQHDCKGRLGLLTACAEMLKGARSSSMRKCAFPSWPVLMWLYSDSRDIQNTWISSATFALRTGHYYLFDSVS